MAPEDAEGGDAGPSHAGQTSASSSCLSSAPQSCEAAAEEIEAVLFEICGRHAPEEYRQRARMLRSNLAHPQNTKLRKQVLLGSIRTAELCRMDSRSLAPEATQRHRQVAERRAL